MTCFDGALDTIVAMGGSGRPTSRKPAVCTTTATGEETRDRAGAAAGGVRRSCSLNRTLLTQDPPALACVPTLRPLWGDITGDIGGEGRRLPGAVRVWGEARRLETTHVKKGSMSRSTSSARSMSALRAALSLFMRKRSLLLALSSTLSTGELGQLGVPASAAGCTTIRALQERCEEWDAVGSSSSSAALSAAVERVLPVRDFSGGQAICSLALLWWVAARWTFLRAGGSVCGLAFAKAGQEDRVEVRCTVPGDCTLSELSTLRCGSVFTLHPS